ncbi:hypothetical protein GCM10027592_31430 [Spirosoma flavus]
MIAEPQPNEQTKQLIERLDVIFALQAANLGVWEYDPITKQTRWDERCRALYGLHQANTLSYEQAFPYIHPDDQSLVREAMASALTTTSDGHYDVTFRTVGGDDGQLRWVRFTGKAEFNPADEPFRLAGIAQDVTAQRLLEQTQQEVLKPLFEQSPVAIAFVSGDEFVFRSANPFYCQLVNRSADQLIGQPLFKALPELQSQGFEALLRQVMATGTPFVAPEVPVDLLREGKLETIYVGLTYQPQRNTKGYVNGILVVATDVTPQVQARQRLEETLGQMQSLVESAPFPIGVYTGRQMRIRLANQAIIDIYGKGPDVIGKSYLDLLPELADQHIFEQLLHVYDTGIPFASGTQRVNIDHQGKLVPYYFNYNFTPLFNAQGHVYGVMNTAADVTELELARQRTEDTASALQNAIQLAQLGTFSVDLAMNTVTVSPRVTDWFGLDSLTADVETFIAIIDESERDYVRTNLYNTLLPGSDGRYEVINSVTHAKTGQRRILQSMGRVYLDATGQPSKIEGTAQDITAQQELQQVLEQQVSQRTQELAAASEALALLNQELMANNQKLATTNEDFADANQTLEVANVDLLRSNQNLEQFAYIASHDLQEPLRKIQQFGDLLQGQYGDALGEGAVYLKRMQAAASRMSVLIKDLLAFSRIATSQAITHPVSLPEVVQQVLEDLSVVVQESGAQIELGKLPTVQGDRLQLGQLFQNLLSNALKFRRTNATGQLMSPQIAVRAHQVAKGELPISVKPTRDVETYHLIEVEDNGIGFEAKYVDRIFQVFQRLHGKNEFAGTGVGLAIVQKVVTNHGGAVTASGQPNQGARFCIYLPV